MVLQTIYGGKKRVPQEESVAESINDGFGRRLGQVVEEGDGMSEDLADGLDTKDIEEFSVVGIGNKVFFLEMRVKR